VIVTGPNEETPRPCPYSQAIDYEFEFEMVIGKEVKYLQPEEALDYVAGYTIVNDLSARRVTFIKNRFKGPWDEFYDWLSAGKQKAFCRWGPCCYRRNRQFAES